MGMCLGRYMFAGDALGSDDSVTRAVVLIHVPQGGRLDADFAKIAKSLVSIHAPARGATSKSYYIDNKNHLLRDLRKNCLKCVTGLTNRLNQ